MRPDDIPAELLAAAEAEPKKRAKPANYNPLVKKRLRDMGYLPVLTEHYDARTRRKHDFFGCVDWIGLGGELGTLAVQVTSKANMSSRIKKIASDELAEGVGAMRKTGWRIVVWGYYKLPNGRWAVKETDVS